MPPRRIVVAALVLLAAVLGDAGPAAAQEPPPPGGTAVGRRWPMPVPSGCAVPELAQVVFLGTVVDTDFQTARYRLDQVRAGDLQSFSYGGLVDVRYGPDTQFLQADAQYLIGASVDPTTNILTSRVREVEPLFAGDEVIGVAERSVTCPQVVDPVRTLDTDGTAVDASVLGPLTDAKGDLLRAILLPLGVALAIVFGLVALRWILTGVGKGVGSVVHTAGQTREVRAAMRGPKT